MAHDPSVLDMKSLLVDAIHELYRRDASLIRRGVHEVTIAHRLALYIENLLRESGDYESSVDIEYNRNMRRPKELVENEGGKRPDIIVHKRESNRHNRLILELKKNKALNIDDDDDRKLKGATNENGVFRFDLGVYLNLREHSCLCTWYCNGRKLGRNQTVKPRETEG